MAPQSAFSGPSADAAQRWADGATECNDYVAPAIVRAFRDSGGASVLDAGCGNGVIAARLAEAGAEVTGIDADPEAVAAARLNCPAGRFETGTFGENPPGSFDFVVSTEVIEHLYDPEELAAYCYRALRPGGTLAITTPYHGYLKNLALAVTGKLDAHFTVGWRGGHIKFFSRATLTQLLEQAGFEIVRFQGIARAPLLWKSMLLVAKRPSPA